MENETEWELGKIFFIILIIGSIFEVGLLVFAYVNADEVECNLFWCTFTKEYSSESRRECFMNGNPVNCSEIKEDMNI